MESWISLFEYGGHGAGGGDDKGKGGPGLEWAVVRWGCRWAVVACLPQLSVWFIFIFFFLSFFFVEEQKKQDLNEVLKFKIHGDNFYGFLIANAQLHKF